MKKLARSSTKRPSQTSIVLKEHPFLSVRQPALDVRRRTTTTVVAVVAGQVVLVAAVDQVVPLNSQQQ